MTTPGGTSTRQLLECVREWAGRDDERAATREQAVDVQGDSNDGPHWWVTGVE